MNYFTFLYWLILHFRTALKYMNWADSAVSKPLALYRKDFHRSMGVDLAWNDISLVENIWSWPCKDRGFCLKYGLGICRIRYMTVVILSSSINWCFTKDIHVHVNLAQKFKQQNRLTVLIHDEVKPKLNLTEIDTALHTYVKSYEV